VLIFYLAHVPIPCTRWTNNLINKHTGGLSRDLHFSVEEVKANLTGEAQLRNLKLGSPPVVTVPDLTLKFAINKLLTGKLFLQSASADTAIVHLRHWEIMDSVDRVKERVIPASGPNRLFEKGGLSLKSLVVRDTANRQLYSCHGLQIKARTTGTGDIKGRLRIQSIKIRQVPEFGPVLASWRHGQVETALMEFTSGWLEGSLWANMTLTRGTAPGFRGTLTFGDLNLKELSRAKLLKNAVFEGKASGILVFHGHDWRNPIFNGKGRFSIRNASMKGFPFQKDKVITHFMPGLASLRFQEIKSARYHIRGDKIHFKSLSANGDPLSFSGTGSLSCQGNINLNLHCLLETNYHRALKSYVRDGIPKNRDGIPNFRCRISGDTAVQRIYLDDVVFRIIQVNLKRFGKKLRSLLKGNVTQPGEFPKSNE
jgi:hypothetical protein